MLNSFFNKRETFCSILSKYCQAKPQIKIPIAEPKNIQNLRARKNLILKPKELPNLKISEPKDILNANPRRYFNLKTQTTESKNEPILNTRPFDIQEPEYTSDEIVQDNFISEPNNELNSDLLDIIKENSENLLIVPISEPNTAPNGNPRNQRVINRENDPRFIVGYRGEAYIYEMLCKLVEENKFKKVYWNALSSNKDNPCVTTVNNRSYNIKEDGLHYDLKAEDFNGEEYYFEVKSSNKFRHEVTLSNKQINFSQSVCHPHEHHYVVCVLNVSTEPFAIFYKKDNQFCTFT